MQNELIFLLHLIFLSLVTLGALYKGGHILRALVIGEIVAANIFVVRQMRLFGITACGGGMYVVSGMTGVLLLRQFYGEKYARDTITLSLCGAALFWLLCWFQLSYQSASLDQFDQYYQVLLGRVPAVTFFSLLAHAVSQYITLTLTSFLSQSRALWVGQILDSIIFFTGVFWGQPLVTRVHVIGFSVALKTLMVFFASPLLMLARYMPRLSPICDNFCDTSGERSNA